MVWFREQKSLLGIIRIERELSELLGVKIDLLTEQAVSPYLVDSIRDDSVERFGRVSGQADTSLLWVVISLVLRSVQDDLPLLNQELVEISMP